jgi:hypothetical protein
MKVRDLQDKLNKLNPDLEVVCYSEDEILQKEGHVFHLFDIESIGTTFAERVRIGDNTPYLKLGKGPDSEELAILTITLDF